MTCLPISDRIGTTDRAEIIGSTGSEARSVRAVGARRHLREERAEPSRMTCRNRRREDLWHRPADRIAGSEVTSMNGSR